MPPRTCSGCITVYHDFLNRERSGRQIVTVWPMFYPNTVYRCRTSLSFDAHYYFQWNSILRRLRRPPYWIFVKSLIFKTVQYIKSKFWMRINMTICNVTKCLNIPFWKSKMATAAILWKTRMWANAQRDGRPAEYRWRPLFNAAKFGWRPLLDDVQ